MFKKLAILGSGAALLLSAALPTFAKGFDFDFNKSGEIKNDVHIDADITNVANTGSNSQGNYNEVSKSRYVLGLNLGAGGSRNIVTGNAEAQSNTEITANVNTTPKSGGLMGIMPWFGNNNSDPENKVHVDAVVANGAYTGGNTQDDVNSVRKSCGIIVGNVGLSGASRNIQTGYASGVTNTTIRVNSNINSSVSIL